MIYLWDFYGLEINAVTRTWLIHDVLRRHFRTGWSLQRLGPVATKRPRKRGFLSGGVPARWRIVRFYISFFSFFFRNRLSFLCSFVLFCFRKDIDQNVRFVLRPWNLVTAVNLEYILCWKSNPFMSMHTRWVITIFIANQKIALDTRKMLW